MTSHSEGAPSRSNDESDWPHDNNTPPAENRTEKLKGKQNASPTIQAMRIPADGTPLHMIDLPLVDATADYHFGLFDANLYHSLDVDGMRAVHRHGVDVLVPPLGRSEDSPDLFNDKARDISRGQKTKAPHMTFTHASLRHQPDVLNPYWASTSEDAWNDRAFQRLHGGPIRPKDDGQSMQGEYHVMYTAAIGKGLLPNKHVNYRIFGDAFVLKMASGKNAEGDLYYEDVPPRILSCSLGEHCLVALRYLPSNAWDMRGGDKSMEGLSEWVSPDTIFMQQLAASQDWERLLAHINYFQETAREIEQARSPSVPT